MPDASAFEPRPPFEAAFRAALEGADAYRAVRVGLRVHDDILRIGNRFVPNDRFREIGFVALGNASGSMALAAQEMLGERLTQGLSAGAGAAPEALQFRHVSVSDPWPGSAAAESARANVFELVSGLGAGDLLLVLLSPGAFSITAGPPAGWNTVDWRHLLQEVTARSGPVDAVRLARTVGTGAVGGRLGAAVPEAMVATLVVDRGEGAEWVGGGPTIPVRSAERTQARSLVLGTAAASVPSGPEVVLGPNVHRPVVVTGPADAIEGGGNLLAGQGWVSRMAALHLDGTPEEVATQFVEGMEKIRREQVAAPGRPLLSQSDTDSGVSLPRWPSTDTPVTKPESRGLAVLAGATFRTVEGGERADDVAAFLRAAAHQLTRREAYVGALRTAGDLPDRGESAGRWLARRTEESPSSGPRADSFPVRPGFTDVGTLLVGLVPWVAR